MFSSPLKELYLLQRESITAKEEKLRDGEHGDEKSCVWHARDFADGKLKDEIFCIRFASIENCKTFMQKFIEVAEDKDKKEENKDASDTGG